ncbi:MAG: hypothetical protein ACI8XV_002868 [Arenicella sp.]|jgi:hypothetical protein
MNKTCKRIIVFTIWIITQLISIPAHAQCSSEETGGVDCISSRVPIVNVKNLVCTDFDHAFNRAAFELENLEPEDLIVIQLNSNIDKVSAEHISPPLPFVLQKGATVQFIVESETNTMFLCATSDYRLSYQFDSESGRFKGISGAIRLTPSK